MSAVKDMAEAAADITARVLEVADEHDAARVVRRYAGETVNMVDALDRLDPYDIADAVVNGVSAGLGVAGYGDAANIVRALAVFLGRWIRKEFPAVVEGTHVEGTADLT